MLVGRREIANHHKGFLYDDGKALWHLFLKFQQVPGVIRVCKTIDLAWAIGGIGYIGCLTITRPT